MPIIPPRLQRPFAQFDLADFEMVARLDAVRIRQHDTALQARAHFGDIVLDAAARGDRRRRDDDVLTSETRWEVLAERDRKSVGSGKSVSRRVDLGGGGTFK